MTEMNEEANDPMTRALLEAVINRVVDIDAGVRGMTEEIKKMNGLTEAERELAERVLLQHALLQQLEGVIGEVRVDMGKIRETTSERLPLGEMKGLREDLVSNRALFEQPLKRSIHHTHYMGRPVWVIAGLLCVIVLMSYFLNHSEVRADAHVENDVKWRYLKLTDDSAVLRKVHLAEEAFSTDAVQMEKGVEAEEERRKQLFERWLQVNENMKEIRQLEGKGR